MKQEAIHAYLERIGAAAKTEVSVPALRSLVRAHLEQVPFENLDMAGHPCPLSLKEEDLFDKVVVRRRGGYCFELNKLFFLLLRELGYDCYPAAARILYRRTLPRPLSHRVTIVRLDGEKWMADVGYGGPGPKGLLCLSGERQEVAGEYFSTGADGDERVIYRHDPDEVRKLISFRDEPWPEVDFETLNGYYSLHPDSIFTQKTLLYRCIPNGQYALVDDQFSIQETGRPSEPRTVSDPAARRELLGEYFGLFI